jgi:nucleoid-associated protein YgaU
VTPTRRRIVADRPIDVAATVHSVQNRLLAVERKSRPAGLLQSGGNMKNWSSPMSRRVTFAAVSGIAFCVGCATPPPPAPAPAPAPVVTEAPAPAPAALDLTPAQAKAQAQKLAIEAVDMLQNGDEPGARAALDKALALEAGNDLARKLMDQIRADPEKELGSTFFRYTVQRDDSLSKLAQAYLGDRFRFYILARYNDITNPSRLAAGQVIKIPGKGPLPAAAMARPAAKSAEPVEPAPKAAVAEPEPAAEKEVERLLQKGREQQRAGNLSGAYATFSDAVRSDPGNRDAVVQRDAARQALVRRYERDATQAFQRQNLDLAIKNWDAILELEPTNQKAKLERERAVDLKKRMSEKFGAK